MPLDHVDVRRHHLVPADALHHRHDGTVHAADGVQRAGRPCSCRWSSRSPSRRGSASGCCSARPRQQGRRLRASTSTRGSSRRLLASRRRSWLFLGALAAALSSRCALPFLRVVPLKMLPYRQQERVPGRHRCTRGNDARATDGAAQRIATYLATRARGTRLRRVFRQSLADGFQRHGAPLLPARRQQRRRDARHAR